MSRLSILLIVVLICIGVGGYSWIQSQTDSLEREETTKEFSQPITLPGAKVPGERGDWHKEYQGKLASVNELEKVGLRDPEITPELSDRLRQAAASNRQTSRRLAARKQIKAIMLALTNYNEIYNRTGPDPKLQSKYFDQSGRLHLSWRVHLLPLLDEKSLYEEFHLDEPYDSPHNKPLIAKMPDVFRDVDDPDGTSLTRFLFVDAPGSLFEGGRFRSLNDITDPRDETILLSEVPKDLSLTWTQPNDLIVNPAAPLAAFPPVYDDDIHVLLAEGSVITIPKVSTPEEILALVTYRGGEPKGILEQIRQRSWQAKQATAP